MPPTKALAAVAKERDQDRRKTILRAAVEVFARKGYHGCRIADVAREAGVAYGLVYHYFRNKEELLQLVFETGWGGFVARIRDAAEGTATLDAKVRRIFQVAFDGYRVDPRGVRVLVLEFARGPGTGEANRRGAFAEIMDITRGMFERAQARGELRPELDPALCAAMLFGAVEMGLTSLVMGLLDGRDEALLGRAQTQLADSFLHGTLVAEGPWKQDRSGSRLKTVKRS
ncbi:MAG TPA: TetR/AcrR family transcriptional regulator [Myxococcaceae bacterium]|jgi:TetR/AcrR family fatty acid metabolism transcriptional regulator|nr:TetR/AcrR family transcriptional regulator [Myxococcaceae bacterium]